MKKLAVLGMGVCIVLAFSSCKSSESAYKKAYEKAKQQELAEPQTTAPVEEVAPVVSAPVEAKVVESAPVGTIREEKVPEYSSNGCLNCDPLTVATLNFSSTSGLSDTVSP